jgi:hypothetical protein
VLQRGSLGGIDFVLGQRRDACGVSGARRASREPNRSFPRMQESIGAAVLNDKQGQPVRVPRFHGDDEWWEWSGGGGQ